MNCNYSNNKSLFNAKKNNVVYALLGRPFGRCAQASGWWIRWCFCKDFLSVYWFPHIEQVSLILRCTTLMCLLRTIKCLNVSPHVEHLWGLSPIWSTRTCLSITFFRYCNKINIHFTLNAYLAKKINLRNEHHTDYKWTCVSSRVFFQYAPSDCDSMWFYNHIYDKLWDHFPLDDSYGHVLAIPFAKHGRSRIGHISTVSSSHACTWCAVAHACNTKPE